MNKLQEAVAFFVAPGIRDEVTKRLPSFEGDRALVAKIEALALKEFKGITAKDLEQFTALIQHVILPDYPVADPKMFSALYQHAVNTGEFGAIDRGIAHGKHISDLGLNVSDMFVPNKDYAGNTQQTFPFLTIKDTYFSHIVSSLIATDANVRKNTYPFMQANDKHFGEVSAALKVPLGEVVTPAYVELLRTVYQQRAAEYEAITHGLVDVLLSLKKSGFAIANQHTNRALAEWYGGNANFTGLQRILQTVDRSYVVNGLNIPLEPEKKA